MAAYLAAPAQARKAPAIVVIREIFGLNDNIRSIARRFAEEGYVALAAYYAHWPRQLNAERLSLLTAGRESP